MLETLNRIDEQLERFSGLAVLGLMSANSVGTFPTTSSDTMAALLMSD